ncbi:MAG: hypothetical protein BGO49_20555 [Planctomycetales bacterium 71-10]|nr:MAG: hypothetical protein BGO49_20555 [Planctomycetales bacterium 71-10]
MATPDDEFRTLGPPPGARPKPSRPLDRDARDEPDRAGRTPTPGGPPPPAQAVPGWGQPAPPRRPEPASEGFETIPPAPGVGRRREAPAPPPMPAPMPPPPPPPAASAHQPWGFFEPPASAAEPAHPGWTMAEPATAVPDPWGDHAPAPPAPPAPPARAAAAQPARFDSQVDTWEQQHASMPPAPAPMASAPRPPSPPPASPLWSGPPAGAAPASPRPPAARPPVDDGGNRTMAIDRVFPALKNPLLTLQFYNTTLRRWSDLGAVRGSFLDLGRATFQDWNPNPEDLAEHHVRLMIDEGALFIKPLPSLNGVYVKMKPNRPAELHPGSRFRIGRHVLAFRPPAPDRGDVEPLRSPDGEVFHARVLSPLGFLDLIGPDGEPYISVPLTKADEPGTRIGRGGARCDLALTGDEWVSGEHARVYLSGGKCFLEDLKSTNGTFLQVLDEMEIERGSVLRPDSGDIIALGGYMVRVVEERP